MMKLSALILFLPSAVLAAGQIPEDNFGEYGFKKYCARAGGLDKNCISESQYLKIEKTGGKSAYIELESTPGNGNVCTYEGPANWQGMAFVANAKENPSANCVVTVTFQAGTAHVSQQGECYCGSGTTLNGLVLKKIGARNGANKSSQPTR